MPLVTEGGIIVSHDSISETPVMSAYLEIIKNHPQLETVTIATESSQTGMTICCKRMNSDLNNNG